jgi:Zn-dependent peptidase ImmA (M78 family)
MRWTVTHLREKAEALLNQERMTEPPVPIERLAHRCGAQIVYEPFEGELSGLLYRDTDQIVIGVNALHAKNRQRFTIAHEVAHLLLHSGQDLFIDRNFSVRHRDDTSAHAVDPDEMAANAFAAELLMPASMVAQDVGTGIFDIEDDEMIQRLALRYRVSQLAMTIRLTNLGYLTQSDADR